MPHKLHPPDVSSISFSDYLIVLCVGRNARYALERKRTLKYFRSITGEIAPFYPRPDILMHPRSLYAAEILAEEPARASNVCPWKAPPEIIYRYRLSIPGPNVNTRVSSEACWYEAHKKINDNNLVWFRQIFSASSSDDDSGYGSSIATKPIPAKSTATKPRLFSTFESSSVPDILPPLSSDIDNPLSYFLETNHAVPAGSSITNPSFLANYHKETWKEEDKKWLLTSILTKVDTAARYDIFLHYPEMIEFVELICMLVAGHPSSARRHKALSQQTIDLLRMKFRCSQSPLTPDLADKSVQFMGKLLMQCSFEELAHMENAVRHLLEELPVYEDEPIRCKTPVEYKMVNTSLGRMKMSKTYPESWDHGSLAAKYCAW